MRSRSRSKLCRGPRRRRAHRYGHSRAAGQECKKPQALAKSPLTGGKVTLIDKKGRKGNNLVDILYSGDNDFNRASWTRRSRSSQIEPSLVPTLRPIGPS